MRQGRQRGDVVRQLKTRCVKAWRLVWVSKMCRSQFILFLQVVNVDGERALVAVRATGGSADASLGVAHMAAGVAVGSFEIEDLLVGARCPAHAYLARSFEARSGGAAD